MLYITLYNYEIAVLQQVLLAKMDFHFLFHNEFMFRYRCPEEKPTSEQNNVSATGFTLLSLRIQ